ALDVIQSPLAQTIITPEPVPIPTIVKTAPKIIIPPKPAPVISPNKIGKFIVQDGVATDTETGLMWLRFAHGQRWENGAIEGIAEKVNWHDAMKIPTAFIYGHYNDWRVPNIDELKTLIDKVKGTSGNYIDADVFPKSDKFFWSSSSCDNMTKSNRVWFVYFNNGHSATDYKNGSNCVRLVRG
ncbi:MAG: DUF1566 domain-containing protein, partial [Methylococcaceae bacterium]